MKIIVTQEDIDAGKAQCCDSCPVALAAQRAGLTNTRVGEDTSFYYDYASHEFKHFGLPREARAFIKRFDDGKKVEPFEFEVKP